MNGFEVLAEVGKMTDAKADFNRVLFEVLQTKDKNKLIEILVENAVYDIRQMECLDHVLGMDSTPP